MSKPKTSILTLTMDQLEDAVQTTILNMASYRTEGNTFMYQEQQRRLYNVLREILSRLGTLNETNPARHFRAGYRTALMNFGPKEELERFNKEWPNDLVVEKETP